jgi:1-acyl-sn-glycerol-3-phosphate acyltransferase
MGEAMQTALLRDPLGIANIALANLKELSPSENYTVYDGHIFSADLKHTLVFISPAPSIKESNNSEQLTKSIENALEKINVNVDVFGSSIISAYNSRQIKKDGIITLSIAIIVIALFISLTFRRKRILPLMFAPVIFGALFSLTAIYFIQGTISAIAIGAGAVVMGIAMSYSIHVITHSYNVKDVKTLIKDISSPLTIGSFTTIGAFVGLIFTHSPLLRDFGIFASFTLTGTTLFCLIFLPHFLIFKGQNKKSALLSRIERANIFSLDKNKWALALIAIITVICLCFYNKVRFNTDMLQMSYIPETTAKAERLLDKISANTNREIIFVCNGDYQKMSSMLAELKEQKKIINFSSASDFLVPAAVQKERIKKWTEFWTDNKKSQTIKKIKVSAAAVGFEQNAFKAFEDILQTDFVPFSIDNLYSDVAGSGADNNTSPIGTGLWQNFTEQTEQGNVFLAHVTLTSEQKEYVYSIFDEMPDVSIIDRTFFAKKITKTITDDFSLVLYISSILIFLALLLSYGRIELAVLAFIPMMLSWIIILGLMAVFGLEFNLINIILSAFIFGIGDDFSIFILDGLLKKYKDGTDLLKEHKTAIFFSGFTILVGTGVLIFAKHPAMHSLALISVLGILAVILISFTVQPVLFRLLISKPAEKGGYPYTFTGLLNSLYAFTVFVSGCLTVQVIMLTLLPLPIRGKKRIVQYCAHIFLKAFLFLMPSVRYKRFNPFNENFKKPAVIAANHSSFIDIIMMMGLTPKIVMVTNRWVWKNPVFGGIVRYLGFQTVENGYENMLNIFSEKVRQGYSIAVFPEGTRTHNGEIQRFHKGAFYLAEKLGLDIIPVIFYGNGMISSKTQPFFIKRGICSYKILQRIPPANGITYTLRAKEVTALFRKEYATVKQQFSTSDNPYFFNTLIKNYIYKNPVLEWYMRVKIRMEETYRVFNERIPLDATVVDVGCGYAPLSYALSLYSPQRQITGIDYDEEKIAVAQHCFLKNASIRFIAADISDFQMPDADVFIINDTLHYLSYSKQEKVINECLRNLRPNGFLIIRDSDTEDTKRHKKTLLSERFSVKIFKFNKANQPLNFFSSVQLEKIVNKAGFKIAKKENDKHSSNVIYTISNSTEHI